MKEYAPGSISWAISNALRERYPDGVAGHGAWVQIAREFGGSRQLVWQIADAIGIKRRNKVRMVRVCSSCGKCVTGQSGRPSMFCAACVKIPLACDECGVLRREYTHLVLRRFNDEYTEKRRAAGWAVPTGRYFCSRACFGKRAGREHGWGNPEHPHNAHKGEHGRVSQYMLGCRCAPCKQAMSAYNKQRYALRKAERAAARV